MNRLPDGLAKAIVVGIVVTVIPGMLFGFPSAVLTVGGIVFVAGLYYGLDQAR